MREYRDSPSPSAHRTGGGFLRKPRRLPDVDCRAVHRTRGAPRSPRARQTHTEWGRAHVVAWVRKRGRVVVFPPPRPPPRGGVACRGAGGLFGGGGGGVGMGGLGGPGARGFFFL